MNSNSPAFNLNALDWKKILSWFLVAFAGVVETHLLPMLAGFTYVAHVGGVTVDFTPFMPIVFGTLTTAIQRYVTDHQLGAIAEYEPRPFWSPSTKHAIIGGVLILLGAAIPFVGVALLLVGVAFLVTALVEFLHGQ